MSSMEDPYGVDLFVREMIKFFSSLNHRLHSEFIIRNVPERFEEVAFSC